MKNQTQRFTGGSAKLSVFMKKTSKDLRVGIRIRQEGQPVVTGMRSIFVLSNEAGATAKFAELIAEATKQGWVPKIKVGRSTFSEMPSAADFMAEEEAAELARIQAEAEAEAERIKAEKAERKEKARLAREAKKQSAAEAAA
jgi:signal transduction histidine kinase